MDFQNDACLDNINKAASFYSNAKANSWMVGFTVYVAISLFIVCRQFFVAQGKKFLKEVIDVFDPDTVEVEHRKLSAKVDALRKLKAL